MVPLITLLLDSLYRYHTHSTSNVDYCCISAMLSLQLQQALLTTNIFKTHSVHIARHMFGSNTSCIVTSQSFWFKRSDIKYIHIIMYQLIYQRYKKFEEYIEMIPCKLLVRSTNKRLKVQNWMYISVILTLQPRFKPVTLWYYL